MKRFLSMLLAVAMLFSMVTISYAANEAEAITVEYWNADSTKIIIDLSKEVDADALKAAITLTEDGKNVDFTVTKRVKTVDSTIDATTSGKFNVSGMIVTTEVTYEIAPANGLNFDDVYALTVGADITGSAPWTKYFRVVKLWSDNFDSYTITTDGTTTTYNVPWKLAGGGSGAIKLEDDGTGNKALVWTQKGPGYRVEPSYGTSDANSSVNFGDTGVAASTYWASGSDARKETEYNLEMDLRFHSTQSDAKYPYGIQVHMRNAGHTNNQMLYYNAGIVAGIMGGHTDDSGAYANQMLAGTYGHAEFTAGSLASYSVNGMHAAKSNYYENFYGASFLSGADAEVWVNSLFTQSNFTDGDWSNDTVHEISMSVKNDNVKFSFDDAFENYDFGAHQGNTTKQFGLVTFTCPGGNYGATNTYYVDNIIATKAVEVSTYSLNAPTGVAIATKKITFNLDKNIPAANLKSGLTLTKNGSAVESFEVAQVADTTYTYEITTGESLDPSAAYAVALAAGSYTDADGSLAILGTAFTSADLQIATQAMEVTYWNADTTKITLDLNSPITVADLQAGLTIYKGTETLDGFTVDALTNAATLADSYTYTITPAGGIVEDTVYTIRLANGYYNDADDNVYNLAATYSKSLKVDILLKDEMNYETDTTGETPIPWGDAVLSGAQGGEIAVEEVNSNKALKITTTSKAWYSPSTGYQIPGAQTFADTGVTGRVYGYSNGSGIKDEDVLKARLAEDYNLEVKVKVSPSTANNYSFTLEQNSAYHTEHNSNIVALELNRSSNIIKGRIRNSAASDLTSWSGSYVPNLAGSDYTKVSISAKDGDYKYFAGDAFLHAIHETDIGQAGVPILYFDNGRSNVSNTWYVDDLIMSKATEVTTGFEYGKLVVKANGVAVEDLTGVSTVDASINVMNFADPMTCKVVLAVYNTTTKKMTNVILSDTTSISGLTPFEFKNVALGGGDSISVYFWNNFNDLVPYRAPYDFPTAQ